MPLKYQLQTLAEVILAEAAYTGESIHPVVAALVVDTFSAELHLIEVVRHAEAEKKILATVRQFWSDFAAGVMPPLDTSRDHDLVKSLYPTDNGGTIDLSFDNALPSLMDERKTLAEQITAAEKRKKQIDTEVKDKIGENSFALIAGGRKLSHKMQSRAGHVVGPSEFRVLREVKVR